MHRIFFVLFVTAMSMEALPAQAALTRVWVSGQGVDAPNCGALAAPCRQIKYVLDNGIVAPGGEIDIRDAAGFAPFTITHAVSIINDGAGVASIQATSTSDAIDIKAGPTDGVFLKGLTIDGAGGGHDGIYSASAGRLVIFRCIVKNARRGVRANALLFTAMNLNFRISDTIIENTGTGIDIAQNIAEGNVAGEISRVSISNSSVGVEARFSKMLLSDVSITGSTSAGLLIDGPIPAFKSVATLRRCSIMNNAIGVQNLDAMFTYGDNSITGNAVDISDPAKVTRLTPQ